MADVEIRFLGDADSALSAIAALDAALEAIQKIAEDVGRALADLNIPPSTVSRIVAEAKMVQGALAGIESQAKDTQRALDARTWGLGASSLLAAAVTGRAYTPDRGYFGMGQGGAPGNAEYTAQYQASRGGALNAAMSAYIASRGARGGGGIGMAGLLAAAGMGGGGIGVSRWLNPFGMFGFNLPGARFGSLLGLAGFGAERMLGTSLGIGGSILGAGLGAGLYGLGLGGTMAVGMGTDMAGIGQAAGDIRTVTKDLNALDQAVQMYGKNSQQAAQAQAQLNADLGSFSPVARQAVLNASLASQTFRNLFDYYTGPAEKTGAQIIQQGIRTGQRFLPTLGGFAQGNMQIIQSGLQPFFQWAQSGQGGLGIFTQLEALFQNRLPTAVHAGTQAFELFSHAVLDAAKQTGSFLPRLDEFLTKMTSAQGLARMNTTITHLLDLFKTWAELLISVGRTIYLLFLPAVGLGADFAKQLTHIIDLFDKWLRLTSTQTTLHNLFDAHRQQMDALFSIFAALLPVLEATISAFLKVETVVTRVTVGPLKVLATLITDITKIPFATTILGWAAAAAIIYRGLSTLLELKVVATFAEWTGATAALDTAVGALEVSTAAASMAMGGLAGATLKIIGPIAAAAAVVYGLDKAIKALTGYDPLAKAWGSAGWGADNAAADVTRGKNPYPVGTSLYQTWERGFKGEKPLPGTMRSAAAAKAYKQGQAAEPTGGGGGSKGSATYSHAGLEGLWTQAGGPQPMANIMAAIAQAESGGVVGRVGGPDKNGTFDYGLWQINSSHGYDTQKLLTDPLYNAKAAVSIYHSQGLGAWTTFLSGAYTRYLTGAGGVSGGTSPGSGVPGAATVPKGVPPPSNPNLSTAATRKSVLAQGLGALSSLGTARGDLGSLPQAWRKRFAPELHDWQQQLEHLDKELRDKTLSTKTVDAIRSRIDLLSRYITTATKRIQTEVAAWQALTTGHGILANIHLAMGGSLSALGATTGSPLNPMNVNVLATTRANLEPKLAKWEAEITSMDKTLRDKSVSQATVNTITQRMTTIQTKVQDALTKIKDAAQTQLAAAQNAWSAFMSTFDSTLSGTANMNSAQLQAAQQQLAQDRLAVQLDRAQSAVLGGSPSASDNLAQQIVNNMTAVLGIQTTGTGTPYTQQQLDNWLNMWGAYYASQGYTPEQMFQAFNALLASVGLPPIDNPFGTGSLPLPPGAGGAAGTGTPGTPGIGLGSYAAAMAGGIMGSIHGALSGGATTYKTVAPRTVTHKLTAVHSTSTHPGATNVTVHLQSQPHVEVKLEKGLEWLDNHIIVTVDGEVKKLGQKANARARSGRYSVAPGRRP